MLNVSNVYLNDTSKLIEIWSDSKNLRTQNSEKMRIFAMFLNKILTDPHLVIIFFEWKKYPIYTLKKQDLKKLNIRRCILLKWMSEI